MIPRKPQDPTSSGPAPREWEAVVSFLLLNLVVFFFTFINGNFTLGAAILVGFLGLLFTVLELFGELLVTNTKHPFLATRIYFLIQFGLCAALNYLGSANYYMMWLISLPLVSQALAFSNSKTWRVMDCAGVPVAVFVPMVLRFGFVQSLLVMLYVIPAYLFVWAFSRLVLRERGARMEVERLAAQLQEANEKLRATAAQTEELAVTKERNRLAREIHDSLGHYLTVVNVQIGAALTVLDRDRSRARDALEKASQLTREGLAEVRGSVSALRETPLAGRPLSDALKVLAEDSWASAVETRLRVEGTPEKLPPEIALALYRVAQEGLTNVRKHAHSTLAELHLAFQGDHVCLTVRDNGIGTSDTSGGFGLIGLRERLAQLGGTLRVESRPGSFFHLQAIIPSKVPVKEAH